MTPYLPPSPAEEEASIEFHTEEGGQEIPTAQVEKLAAWVSAVLQKRGGQLGTINYILCGDDYLLQLNQDYLQHDTLTDIITFPMAEFPVVSGDIFISTERVADNANELGITYHDELCRVLIHGILHLCGQGDKSPAEAEEMRSQEDWALSLRK